MLSRHRLQSTLNEIGEITGRGFALVDKKGKKAAYTSRELAEKAEDFFAQRGAVEEELGDTLTFCVEVEEELEYLLLMENSGEDSPMIGRLAVCQIRGLVLSAREQYDRSNFIRNILLGNMLSVDIYSRAKKLHIDARPRVVFVIDTADKGNDEAIEFVKNLSDIKAGDFVVNVDEHSVVLVKDVSSFPQDTLESRLQEIAAGLVDNLHMEAMIKVRVGYGNAVGQIPELARSFQEAKMALEVGRVFYAGHDTISYGNLGIGRLIYQLPMSLCDMYIKEVFGDEVPKLLEDEEAMSTISKFFENNLNISETARQLYVHRNTLVYRLERIYRSIGLDIRRFDDAMTFRIAVMVLAHIRQDRERG